LNLAAAFAAFLLMVLSHYTAAPKRVEGTLAARIVQEKLGMSADYRDLRSIQVTI
jgi:hypothetical protein